MEDLKVGDEVICDKSYPKLPQKGWKGKVVHIFPDFSYSCAGFGIEWEHPFVSGHGCSGKGKNGYCRYYSDTPGSFFSDLSIIKKVDKQLELFA